MFNFKIFSYFYRRCNQQELNLIKQNSIDWVLSKLNMYELALQKKFDQIPYSDIYIFTNYKPKNIENYGELVYNSLYKEYLETISCIRDLNDLHPEYINIDYEKLSAEEKEKLDLSVMYNNGYDNFLELQNELLQFNNITFDEYCRNNKREYEKQYYSWDTNNIIEWTELDSKNLKNGIFNKKILCGSIGAPTKIYNGTLYTNKDTPNNIISINDFFFDIPEFHNVEELIDWVMSSKKECKEDLLTEEEIKMIQKIFEEHDNDMIVVFQ